MRLNRFLASAGLGSRRSCEELIRTGQVTINGAKCEALATQVEPSDVVKVGNRVLHSAAPMTLVLHKPPGFVCTASDTHDRLTVFDLLPPDFPRLFHVGRLDKESEGLLILTNDGSLSLKLTHPRYKVEKEYEVVLDQPFDFSQVEKLLNGIRLQDGWAKAEAVFRLGASKLKVILRQGMKRQLRLMFYELGYEVVKLSRVRIGSIRIEGLPAAHWRALKVAEIEELLAGVEVVEAESPPLARGETAGDAPEASEKAEHETEGESERPAQSPREPRPEREPRASRPPREPRSGSDRGPRSYADRPQRGERPPRGEFRSRDDRPKRFGSPRGKVEDIPFVPRASRNNGERGERSERPARPPQGDRPYSRPRDYSDRPPRHDGPRQGARPRRDLEEIPFVPRAARPGAERSDRPERPAYRSGPRKSHDDSPSGRGEGGDRRERPGKPFGRPGKPSGERRFEKPRRAERG